MGEIDLAWIPPGPGLWVRDPTHFPVPTTPFNAVVIGETMRIGSAAGYERFGVPLGGRLIETVNDWSYSCVVPLRGPDAGGREETATRMWASRTWRDHVRRWQVEQRPGLERRARALQSEDPWTLDDDALALHVEAGIALWREGATIHFANTALGVVIGDFLVAAARVGVLASDAAAFLRGASPASSDTLAFIDAIATALRDVSATQPATADDICAASPAAARALHAYLDTHGWRTVSSFDVSGKCLVELPEAIVASVLARIEPSEPAAPPDPSAFPPDVVARLEEARLVYGVRDDDVGVGVQWPRGLVRRALLVAGARLTDRSRLSDPDDIFSTTPAESLAMLRGRPDPTSSELAARTAARVANADAQPPETLGIPDAGPRDDLPPALTRSAAAMAAYGALQSARGDKPFTGTGIGTTRYRGRAVVATHATDAIARFEPGDVLIAVLTTPAFNTVLAAAGGLVVEHGGVLAHAGIMARELGLPAVLGVAGATTAIPDGAMVEVDPVAGTVRVL